MPELPEVETTRRGIAPHVEGLRVSEVIVRQPSLRWPVPLALQDLRGEVIERVERRAKYLLFHSRAGCMLVHLGMSGNLRIVSDGEPVRKHDHVDLRLAGGHILRFHDPRRFGCVLWLQEPTASHPLLADLGPEPFSDSFSADYLYARSRKRSAAVKSFIMDGHIVVGVGNIYANEALFAAGIAPGRKAGSISLARYQRLVAEIRHVLGKAIDAGGTTLRDFIGGDGKPGYFSQSLQVYGRGGQTCVVCRNELQEFRLGQRSTVYCPKCQR